MQGKVVVTKLTKVTDQERLGWAHDRMMRALRLALVNREDRAIVTAALARAAEYDEMLTLSRMTAQLRRQATGRPSKRGRPPKVRSETTS